jgi:RND family efflux transporter MFP subunit
MKATGFFVLTLAAAGLLTACGSSDKKGAAETVIHSVMTTHPTAIEGREVKNFSGVVKENATISLSFRAGGQIQSIPVKEGQHVRRGQLLAQLDTKDYQIAVDNARVQLDQMHRQVERMKALYEGNAMNGNDYELATSKLELLELQLQNAENQLSYTRLTAPCDGYIQGVHREQSEMVGVGTPVISLVDDRRREIQINVPSDVARDYDRYDGAYFIHNGQRYPLDIIAILHKADANQLYNVRLATSAPIRPGQSVDVYIEARASENEVLTVPTGAVFEDAGKSYVWVLKDNKLSRRAVTANKVDKNGKVIITSGLEITDEVVKAGVTHLTEGEIVRVVTGETSNVGDLL